MPGSPKLILILGVIFSLPKWPIDPSLKLKTRRHHCLMWTACSMVHPPLPLPLLLNFLVKFHQSICCWKFFFSKKLVRTCTKKIAIMSNSSSRILLWCRPSKFPWHFFRTHTHLIYGRERGGKDRYTTKSDIDNLPQLCPPSGSIKGGVVCRYSLAITVF